MDIQVKNESGESQSPYDLDSLATVFNNWGKYLTPSSVRATLVVPLTKSSTLSFFAHLDKEVPKVIVKNEVELKMGEDTTTHDILGEASLGSLKIAVHDVVCGAKKFIQINYFLILFTN